MDVQVAHWVQNYYPLGSVWTSGFVALLPIILFFICLVWLNMKGWLAATLTVGLSCLIALTVYKMPFEMVILSFIQGFLTGIWPIAWIIIAAIFLYKISVKTGYFDILKHSVMGITQDQRLQVVLIAFCFGAFLEGAIGFGGPVAITAAILVGLGLRPLYAAGLCMIANTAPVAFGAVGIPIIALARSVGVEANDLAAMVGRMLPPLTIFVPFFIVFLMSGMKGVKETFPAVAVASISFVVVQFISSNYIGPELPDIISAIASIACTSIFLRFWQPKNIYKADNSQDTVEVQKYSSSEIITAWMPFILLIFTIILWQIPAFKSMFSTGGLLESTTIRVTFDGAHNLIMQSAPIVSQETPLSVSWNLDLIRSSGTAIFLAALISILVLKANAQVVVSSAKDTMKEMMIPIITIGLVLAFAFVSRNSGQAATMGLALAHTGDAFTFFSPVIGWIGVFLTGSDTSSNLLFGPLQQVTANQLGMSDTLFLAANTVGGVVGKMISPQSIAIACAAVGLAGKESDLFKFTVKYSILFIIFISIWVTLIAHFFPWIIVNHA